MEIFVDHEPYSPAEPAPKTIDTRIHEAHFDSEKPSPDGIFAAGKLNSTPKPRSLS